MPTDAPGHPGMPPTWTSSRKDLIGTAIGPSRLWFTVGTGIINEVYAPRIDIAQIRDLGFIVADDHGFWVEVKRLGNYRVRTPAPGIPAVDVIHEHPRFSLRLRVTPDSDREVLQIEVLLAGDERLRVYALVAPHLGGRGIDNYAECASYRGRKILWAERYPFGMALAAVDRRQHDAWGRTSAGYVGVSDSWQDFSRHGRMTETYIRAGPGNVSLMGEIPRYSVLALAFGSSKESAATLAISALLTPFERVWQRHVRDWRRWHQSCRVPAELPNELQDMFLISAMVLRAHQDKIYPGAMVASLSIPWGNSRDDLGGYHLVWPRDLVQSAEALLALGAVEESRNILRYLVATQNADGHWYQNSWLGGKPYWTGVQLDEAAFPILLAAQLANRGALDGIEVGDMVQRALAFIARQGPNSEQDRWEEDSGINTFTLAVCIAALVCGSSFLAEPAREAALSLADDWNAQLEDWTTAGDSALTRRFGVERYYVRVAPPRSESNGEGLNHILPIKNQIHDPALSAAQQVAVDFLQLVRFGLRLPDDPVVVQTLTVTDGLLKIETPFGPSWHRYNGDGYGEHEDGSPFSGHGIGRSWPLLSGERGHYALLAGKDPLPYLRSMAAMTGSGGLIPEQVWDTEPIPERQLAPGRPSGSAMPLVWAHAEFIKLACSLAAKCPVDRPERVWRRYRGLRPTLSRESWWISQPRTTLQQGNTLRIYLPAAASVHWGVDDWCDIADTRTRDTALGLHVAELATEKLRPDQYVVFVLYWLDARHWEDRLFQVKIVTRSVDPYRSAHEGSPVVTSG